MTDFGGAITHSNEYDVVILGIPYDEKSSFLQGPAQGPKAIREASTGKAINAWTELHANLEEDIVMVDLGDVDASGDFIDLSKRIEVKVFETLENNAVPILLGGDHSISYPIVKAFARKFQTLDILLFDAHPDLYEEIYGDRFSHGCPFARIMEENLAQKLVQVGIRAAVGQHREKAKEHNVQIIEMKDIGDNLEFDFSGPLYISFDMDALDPAFAPGVSHHEPGGLSTRQVLNMLHGLKANIVGMDVVEVNPERDISGITAAAAVKIIKEVAGKIAIEKRLKSREVS